MNPGKLYFLRVTFTGGVDPWYLKTDYAKPPRSLFNGPKGDALEWIEADATKATRLDFEAAIKWARFVFIHTSAECVTVSEV
jgi:hypothetical protein